MLSIISILCLLITSGCLVYLWRTGFFDWVLGRGAYGPTEEEKRLEQAEKEARQELMTEEENKIQRETKKPTRITITPNKRKPKKGTPILTQRMDVFKALEKYDTITKKDFNLSDEWLHAAQIAGWIEKTDEKGLYKVKRDTIRTFKEAKPETNPFAPERIELPPDLIQRMYTKGVVSVGFIPFKTQGPTLEYVIGYTPQTDTLSNPRTTTKLVTALDEGEEGETSIMKIGDISLIAGNKVWEDKTQVIYVEPIHEQKQKAEQLARTILKEFNGVNGKHSFKLAVVKALGHKPSDQLKEKATREKAQAETLEDNTTQLDAAPETPQAHEQAHAQDQSQETEETLETRESQEEARELEEAIPALENTEETIEEGEEDGEETPQLNGIPETPQAQPHEETDNKPYEEFKKDLTWLLDNLAVHQESEITIREFDEFIKNRLQETLRTAQSRRNKLEQVKYIKTKEQDNSSRVWLTEKGIQAINE